MKKSIFGKIGAAAVVLTLVTSSLVGGTFAKYVTNASATATATVAEWKVAFQDNEGNTMDKKEIKLMGPVDADNRAAECILPGDSGMIELNIYGKEAQVGFDYTIDITNNDETVGAFNDITFKYYSDAEGKNEISNTGYIDYSQAADAMNKKIYIKWELPESTNADENTKIAEDLAKAGKTAAYTITMTATQKDAKTKTES